MDQFSFFLNESVEDASFFQAVLNNYHDRTSWLVWADYLDEHSDPLGDYIRKTINYATRTDDVPSVNDLRYAYIRASKEIEAGGVQGIEGHIVRHGGFMLRGPAPGKKYRKPTNFFGRGSRGSRTVKYHLMGAHVEVKDGKPQTWRPIDPKDIPEAVLKGLAIMMLKMWTQRTETVSTPGPHDDKAAEIASRQVAQIVNVIASIWTDAMYFHNDCAVFERNADQLRGLASRLAYFSDLIPKGNIKNSYAETIRWLLQQRAWDARYMTGLIGSLMACEFDERITASLENSLLSLNRRNQTGPNLR